MEIDQFEEARISDRITFLTEIARESFENGILPESRLILNLKRVSLAVNGYFILNECYKKWRIEDGHFTETPKIAALQCMAIMKARPFIHLYPDEQETIFEARANEIYAINCAAALIGIPIKSGAGVKKDFWLRLLDIINSCECDTLEPFLVDYNQKIEQPSKIYVRDVNAGDKLLINCLITIFEALCDQHKPKAVGG